MAADERRSAPRPAVFDQLAADVVEALPTLLDLLDKPPADDVWLPWAACRGMAASAFYPEQGHRTHAHRVCGGCAVRWECLADALGWEPRYHRFGIWGGLNGRERRLAARAVDAARELRDRAAAQAARDVEEAS